MAGISIDLNRPGDVALVRRAIANGWDVPQPVRDALRDQLVPAIREAAERNEPGRGRRACRQMIRLATLALAMCAADALAEYPELRTYPGLPRRREPEKRRPRGGRVPGASMRSTG